jgi:hypothetical protein
MRRAICLITALLFIATIITGFAVTDVHRTDGGPHTGVAILFILATLAHVVVNRKSMIKHLIGSTKKSNE